jgi:hypothetical protein
VKPFRQAVFQKLNIANKLKTKGIVPSLTSDEDADDSRRALQPACNTHKMIVSVSVKTNHNLLAFAARRSDESDRGAGYPPDRSKTP